MDIETFNIKRMNKPSSISTRKGVKNLKQVIKGKSSCLIKDSNILSATELIDKREKISKVIRNWGKIL